MVGSLIFQKLQVVYFSFCWFSWNKTKRWTVLELAVSILFVYSSLPKKKPFTVFMHTKPLIFVTCSCDRYMQKLDLVHGLSNMLWPSLETPFLGNKGFSFLSHEEKSHLGLEMTCGGFFFFFSHYMWRNFDSKVFQTFSLTKGNVALPFLLPSKSTNFLVPGGYTFHPKHRFPLK